jgi:alpha-D-ribose 1-methylphosphonate 5-triphosphate diphosphatase PhnM
MAPNALGNVSEKTSVNLTPMNVPDISEYPVARKNAAINLNAVLAVLEGTPNIINNYKKTTFNPFIQIP